MVNLKLLKELSKNFRVLYVEDDIPIQTIMANYLKKFFLKVVSADNGLDGLELYKKNEFDIVITDLSMPKMNGLDMLDKIRELNKEQAVLITSAHSESSYMIKAIKIGIDGYVIKPFDYEQLNYELFKIVEKLKKFAENEEYKKHLKRMVEQKTSELNSMIHFQKYNYEKTLLSMVEMIEDRDTYTAGHSERVALYSKIIAKEMGHSKDECEKIYQAGILHDIGKIATPDVVLLNPQSLNELEYKLIKEHVEVSYRLLVNIPMFKDLADIVHSHHERYDGKGYPRGLKGDEVIPLARVMIVADAFDAMTTSRIYRGRKNLTEALDELVKLKSIQFHPEVVDSAVKVLKNVTIDENINQLPHTDVEKERFAYFYKDILTSLFNQSYLDVVLVKNRYALKYKFLYLFSLKNFSEYNKQHGWNEGDKILKKISNIFKSYFESSMAFRVFGDDFVLLDKEECDIQKIKTLIDKVLHDSIVKCSLKSINLFKYGINSVSDIEEIQ